MTVGQQSNQSSKPLALSYVRSREGTGRVKADRHTPDILEKANFRDKDQVGVLPGVGQG